MLFRSHINRHRIQAWLGSPVKWADLKLYRLWYIWAGRRTDADVMSYSDTRAQLKKGMDKVVMDHAPVVISRQSGESVVMVSLSDWKAMEETARLLVSKITALRLKSPVAQLNGGKARPHDLIPPLS